MNNFLSQEEVKTIITAVLIRIFNDRKIYKDENKNQIEYDSFGEDEPLNRCFSKFFAKATTVIQVLESMGMITIDEKLKAHITSKFKVLLLKDDELLEYLM